MTRMLTIYKKDYFDTTKFWVLPPRLLAIFRDFEFENVRIYTRQKKLRKYKVNNGSNA